MSSTIYSRAPGKLILSGEHAVVYGQPALATAVDRYITASLRPGGDGVEVRLPAFSVLMRFGCDELALLRGSIAQRYRRYLEGELPVGEVLGDPLRLLPFAIATAAHAAGRQLVPPAELTVDFELPIGSGMGSSAAGGLAVLAACRAWLSLPLDPATLFRDSLACEQLQHGHPSGVDSWICAHGGAVRFQRDTRQPVDLPPLPLRFLHTGTPASSTGTCVSQVRERFGQQHDWAPFGRCTEAIEQALQRDDRDVLCEAIRANHRLLQAIGVVPEPVAQLIAAIEARGGAAKICGAGSVKGCNAGMVMVCCDEPLQDLITRYHLTDYPLQGDRDGTRLDPSERPR